MADRELVWRSGEEAALEAYRRRGYRLLARNWRCPLGEIDLVVGRSGVVVFCEVKARRPGLLGEPFEAVNPVKQRKLRALAGAFLAERGSREAGFRGAAYRFDVASVTVDGPGRARVEVYEDAF
jgi:putative endonuclease